MAAAPASVAHGCALQKLPSSRHLFQSNFGFYWPWAEAKCQGSALPTIHLKMLAMAPPTRKSQIGAGGAAVSHRASHTSPRSLRDRDASTRQPTLSQLGDGPPARPGIRHSNLQQTAARRAMRWTESFQSKGGPKAIIKSCFHLCIAGIVNTSQDGGSAGAISCLYFYPCLCHCLRSATSIQGSGSDLLGEPVPSL